MMGYSSFDDASNHAHDDNKRPHLYSTPAVSAPLITWFGLPTLIECEQPLSSGPGGNVVPGISEEETEFSLSRPLPLSRSHSQPANNEQEHPRHHRISKSFFGGGSASTDEGDDTHSISAYTYRVRTRPTLGRRQTSDDHRLLLCQNPDGTYSHVTPNEDGADDVPESETGLLLMPRGENLKASISLDTVMNLEETLTKMDDGTLPPHVHPSIPTEMLNPEYTRTTPALKMWPLAILVFYNVSGGPFGIEPSIRAGGNFYAILGFIVFPFIWAIPEALVTAELGAAFQDPSAGVAWVEHAFGESMGGLVGVLAWISGATDNAIYPTLFMGYVTSVAGWDKDEFGGLARFGSVAAITICLAMLNYKGLEFVGNASLVICVIAMSPFLIMTIVGAPKVVPSRWFQMPEVAAESFDLFDDDFQISPGPLPLLGLGGILWRPFLNNLFWNLNGFDKAGSFAGETTSVRTTYPRGIFIGLFMCVFGYLIPMLVAVGATDYRQADWIDGHLGVVAMDIGGQWLGMWTIFAAGISNVALFEAEMSSDAFKIMGMAEHGYLPKCFKARSKYGTPTAGIITNTLVIIAFGSADFGQLLELLNCTYAISLLLEYAAFVKLRIFHKDLQRPYRIPIPDWAAILLVIPPTLGIVFLFATSNWYVYVFCAGSLLFSCTLSKLSEVSKKQGLFGYESKSAKHIH